MGTQTGPTSHCVEVRVKVDYGDTGLKRLTIGLWGHRLDQHHTENG